MAQSIRQSDLAAAGDGDIRKSAPRPLQIKDKEQVGAKLHNGNIRFALHDLSLTHLRRAALRIAAGEPGK